MEGVRIDIKFKNIVEIKDGLNFNGEFYCQLNQLFGRNQKHKFN